MRIVLFNHSSLVRSEPTEEQLKIAEAKNKVPRGTPLSSQPVPRVTVAGVLDEGNNTLRLGVSRCSPKDQFSKAHGRKVAEVRADERPSKIVQVPPKEKGTLGRFFYEQAQELIKIAQAEVRIPRYLSGEVTKRPLEKDKLIDNSILNVPL